MLREIPPSHLFLSSHSESVNAETGTTADSVAAKRSQLLSIASVTGRARVVGRLPSDLLKKDDICKLLLCLFFTADELKMPVESHEHDLILFQVPVQMWFPNASFQNSSVIL